MKVEKYDNPNAPAFDEAERYTVTMTADELVRLHMLSSSGEGGLKFPWNHRLIEDLPGNIRREAERRKQNSAYIHPGSGGNGGESNPNPRFDGPWWFRENPPANSTQF